MTPAQRILRTVIQVLIGIAVAVPAAVALVPDVDKALAAKVVGVAGALVLIVNAVQNALEGAGVIPKVLTAPTKPAPAKKAAKKG